MLLARARAEVHAFEACASRFRPGSELCALNADPRRVVPASPRLRAAVAAALWAARETGGLVDPCLLDELEAAGYTRSLAADECRLDRRIRGLEATLVAPARPHPAARWRDVVVDDRRGTIERPPGLRLDLGGSGKGHVADVLAGIVGAAREWLVDAGGDLRVGGGREVRVAHPLRDEPAAVLHLADGAIATSSIVRRSWRGGHHLLDPATGRPAWTGLLSVTALAPTTLHAETLAKAALLSGPDGARRILAPPRRLPHPRRRGGRGGMTDPAEHGWWLASRAAGIVALLCITLSVGVGLAMAGRVSRHPRLARALMAVHQQTALVGLVAIAVHGITLLGDRFMDPGLLGIAVPFVIEHEPLYTGLGIAGGWLAAILGLSYWARNRIGAGLWRKLHRATILVYVLSVVHTLGAGTDASSAWMQTLLVATGAPIVFLFLMRVLPQPRSGPAFRRFRVAEVTPESAAVTSFALEPEDGKPLAPFEPGQFLTVRVDVPGAGKLLRSYSLSAGADPRRHRISVKREGACSAATCTRPSSPATCSSCRARAGRSCSTAPAAAPSRC